MPLLPEDKLIWSPTVANSRMNRSRNASGINSYEQDLGFKPESYLLHCIEQTGKASWLDLCCGEGRALLQVRQFFQQQGLSEVIRLEGVDLIGEPHEGIKIHVIPLLDFHSTERFDLITCVHGLHYIGDKLKAIQNAIGLLSDNGLFVANLDLADINIQHKSSGTYLNGLFKKNNILFDPRQHLLQKRGYAITRFDGHYLGADDGHGKNYTGQESVRSLYTI